MTGSLPLSGTPSPTRPLADMGPTRTLADMGAQVYAWCVRKGWEPDSARTFGDECALLHSEISEGLEAYRERKFDSWEGPDGKPEGVASEFADVFIRLLHYAHIKGIDLQAEFDRKMAYNEKRPYKHGGKTL